MAEPKMKEVKKTFPTINDNNLKHDDNASWGRFHLPLPKGVELEDVTNPDLYKNVARQIPSGSELRVTSEDESFIAWLYVSHSYQNTLVCHVRETLVVDDADIEEASERFSAKLRGPKKWCIIDNHDGSIVKANIATKIACMIEIKDYEQALRS